MKCTILSLCLIFTCLFCFGQKDGTYVSDMGVSCRISKVDPNTLMVESGGRSDSYKRSTGSVFNCTTPKYAQYRMKVESDTKVYAYQEGSPQGVYYIFRDEEALMNAMSDCEITDKYLELIEAEPENVQIWAFCGQAAAVICATVPGRGRDEQLEVIAKTLKLIHTSSSTPCSDAIPQTIWDKN